MTNKERAARLRMAMQNLEAATAWVKSALGDTDAGQDTLDSINDAVEDLMADIIDLENT